MARKDTQNSSKLKNLWNLTIRLFRIIIRTLVLPLCVLMLNRIVWNRSNYLYKNGFGVKWPTKVDISEKTTNQPTNRMLMTKTAYIFFLTRATLHIPLRPE